MPYAALDPDYDKQYNAAWVTLPNSYYDPQDRPRALQPLSRRAGATPTRCGFDGVCVNEHHQNAYGLMPIPGVMAGALSRRTKNAQASRCSAARCRC